jgi:hypothetical protein
MDMPVLSKSNPKGNPWPLGLLLLGPLLLTVSGMAGAEAPLPSGNAQPQPWVDPQGMAHLEVIVRFFDRHLGAAP